MTPEARAEAYVQSALADACSAIMGAPNGLQQRTLWHEARAIGQLVAGGAIQRGEAFVQLLDAARRMPDYDAGRKWRDAQLKDKIARALDRGAERPRKPPEDERAPARPKPPPPAQPAARPKPPATKTAHALAIWREAVPIPPASLGWRYLTIARGLCLDGLDDGRVLRWHERRRAVVALFRNIHTDAEQAVSLIFVGQDGGGERRTVGGEDIKRQFIGPVMGAAIKLDRDEDVTNGLFIGEGVETCLAAQQLPTLCARPIWALGSSVAIEAFPVLAVEALTIIAENGCAASAEAVETCGARWEAAGREARVTRPRDLRHKDFNDVLLALRNSAEA